MGEMRDATQCTGQIVGTRVSPSECVLTWEGGSTAPISNAIWEDWFRDLFYMDALPWPVAIAGEDVLRDCVIVRRGDM